ncbi:twin-arginine translocation signal domain-containing protein [Halobaculum sp. CBA1158]|uniref:twin-arginine translocation signal domain-containing protein n=1 Tax=Halobaculum sp. CBA1158 TaxID=2904243 RepID=UPI001F3B78E0|nr:twin-arginine translocation signal domain-containing protein [Halobaculum sp. CBA1158]UIO99728.1 twin-arginine translocation signal domain-containing protein [Halobaculum sp. CBA1158]
MPSRRDLLRTAAAGLAAGGTAAVAGCGFHSPSSIDHEFEVDTDPDPSAFDCDGHAIRFVVEESSVCLRGQFPAFVPDCRRLTSTLERGPEGLSLTATVTSNDTDFLPPCDGEETTATYTLTAPVEYVPDRLIFRHSRGDERLFEFDDRVEDVADPIEDSC